MGCMSVLFNIIWICTGGISTALGFLVMGLICCITVVGIPLGSQAFKMAKLTLTPFGRVVSYGGGAPSMVANAFWVLLFGWWAALIYALGGVLYCITIVGIPFGLQLFKMAKLALWPFGATVS